MYKEIKIIASLQTPIILQGYMTFDALLGALLFERLQDVDKAHAAIPIQCDNGLFHASAAQLEIIDRGGLAITANLRAQHDLDPDHIKRSKDGERLHRSLGLKRRRQFGAVLNKYKTATASSVSWDVVGEGCAVLRNLVNIRRDRIWLAIGGQTKGCQLISLYYKNIRARHGKILCLLKDGLTEVAQSKRQDDRA
jgi:hypothetical protein